MQLTYYLDITIGGRSVPMEVQADVSDERPCLEYVTPLEPLPPLEGRERDWAHVAIYRAIETLIGRCAPRKEGCVIVGCWLHDPPHERQEKERRLTPPQYGPCTHCGIGPIQVVKDTYGWDATCFYCARPATPIAPLPLVEDAQLK